MNRTENNAWCVGTRLMLLALAFATGTARADVTDEQFLDGLRTRRLFSLAETYCRERLDAPDLSETERNGLVIELARTLAQHALNTPPADRGPRWQAARDVVQQYHRDHPQDPRRLLVQIQDALTVLARGELARQEAELAAAAAPRLDEARDQLREAIRMLTDLDTETATALRERNRDGRPAPAELTADELLALGGNVQYQLARAYRNQALCYPAGSADRANSLTLAAKTLDPLARAENFDPLTWQARIDAITCARLLGDLTAARHRLELLQATELPPPVVLAARAEQIRVELAAGKPEAAMEIVRLGREFQGQMLPDLDYAVLETFIALWQSAAEQKKAEEAAEWQENSAKVVRMIEQLHGPYWLRRAETLLARSASESGSGNVELLVRAAENFYRRGDLDDAVAQYDQAARLSAADGASDEAFDLWFKAAAIEHQRPRPAEAMRRFRELSLAMAEHPQAARAHLLAVLNAANLARESEPARLDDYKNLLREQLEHWPDGDSSDQARWWLGRFCEHRREWDAALAAYREISADFPQYEDALRATARCWQQRLNSMSGSSDEVAREADSAAQWFEAVILGADRTIPRQWTDAQRFAALAAAKIRLTYTRDGFTAAKGVLEAAIKTADEASAQWKSEAQMLLVVALAGVGNRADATQVLRQLSGGESGRLLEMISGLRGLAADAPAAARGDLAKLQLDAVALATSLTDQLSPTDRQLLDLVRAESLAALGERGEALRAYARLAESKPNDGPIQEGYAQLLLETADRPSLELALTKWQEVAARSEPESDRWYRAKYALALAHYRLGNKQRAASLIKYLETLHPDLGGDGQQAKFRELLRQCQP